MSDNERYNYFSMFTPEGKVVPIESIHRSTEHGSVCVALRNKTTAVMIVQKSRVDDHFASNRRKILHLDDLLLYTFSGITNDGERIALRIKTELEDALNKKGTRPPISKLFDTIKFDYGLEVMRYGQRAMGIAAIVAGIDKKGLSLTELAPTGDTTVCLASSIGRRSQSARTVLGNKAISLLDLNDAALLKLGIEAFSNAVNDPSLLSDDTVDIAVLKVGEKAPSFPKYSEALSSRPS